MENFPNVKGYKSLKEELNRVIDVLNNKEKYNKLGVDKPNYLFLLGDAGLGKTTIALDFINSLNNRYKKVIRKNTDEKSLIKYVSDAFIEAKNNQPSVILFDDMDKYANDDQSHIKSEIYITIQSYMDELKNEDIYFIATGNVVNHIPSTLFRSGRFMEMIIQYPNLKDSKEIIEHYLDGRELDKDIDSDFVANFLRNSSCAKIEQILKLSGEFAGYNNKRKIDKDSFTKAYLTTTQGVENLNVDDYDRMLQVANHEAGHALVTELLYPGSTYLVSIKPSLSRIKGVTCSNKAGEFKTVEACYNEMKIALAGKAANEICKNEDVGCKDDIRYAHALLNILIDDYCIYGFDKTVHDNVSVNTLNKRDELISSEMERLYNEVKEMIKSNLFEFEMIKSELLSKTILYQDDLKKIKETKYKIQSKE